MPPQPAPSSPPPRRSLRARLRRRLQFSHLSIRAKMVALIALPMLLVYLVVLGFMLVRLSHQSRDEVRTATAEQAASYAARFDAAFERAATIARLNAHTLETDPSLTEDQLKELLRGSVLADDAVYGAAIAFEPGTFKHDDSLVAPYVYRKGPNDLAVINIGRDVYDWYNDPKWQWWRLPKQTSAPAWTDPYFDKGAGNVLMVTYSVPFTGGRANPTFRGVATVDIQIAKIRDQVGAQIVGNTEFVILSKTGEFVSSPREGDVMSGRTVFDVMEAAGRHDAAEVTRASITGTTGVADIGPWPGKPPAGWERWADSAWIFHSPIRSTGWVFAAMVPESVALAPARLRTLEVAAALAVALALMVGCIYLVSWLVTRRVARLAAGVDRLSKGDLDHRLQITSFDELGQLSHDVNTLARDIKRRTAEILRNRSQSREAMIFALAKLSESRDDDTGKHLERIRLYVELLAAEVARGDPDLDDEWVYTVIATAALHDIGKVGIPDNILKKPGKLTDDERRRMQSHTTIGGDTLIALRNEWTEDDFLRIAAEIALAHHEKWDGTGYPYGLAGEDISLSARVVAVADVYDALTSRRVYKPPMPHDEAVRIITEGAGKHFDPRVVQAFLRVQSGFRAIAESHA